MAVIFAPGNLTLAKKPLSLTLDNKQRPKPIASNGKPATTAAAALPGVEKRSAYSHTATPTQATTSEQ